MVRWFKLFGSQYFGFWALGIVLFVLQEIPYILMPLFHLGSNPIMNLPETSVLLDICEKILGSLCIAVMIFVVHRDAELFSVSGWNKKEFFLLAVFLLLANYAGWALYFSGHQSVLVMMLFIVAIPPLYYVAVGLWRRNVPLAVIGTLFFAVHFIHVFENLKE